jgi:Chalcone isomerase-like
MSSSKRPELSSSMATPFAKAMTRRDALAALVASGAALTIPSLAHAIEVDGIRMAESVDVNGQHLVLNGCGTRHATIFRVNVYVAGLYLPARMTDSAQILADGTFKHLIAVFKRGVGRDQAQGAFRDSIRQAAGGQAGAIASDISRFEQWVPGWEENQRMVATYTPGTGVSITATQARAPFTAGTAFGTALFGTWAGTRPVDDELRDYLTGRRQH